MAAVHRVYVDTNVFIHLFEGRDEVAASLARLFLTERTGREPFLATSELTLAELLVEPYRRKDDKLIQIYDNWTRTNPYLEVGPVDRDALWYAAVFRSQHETLKLPDAVHLSTAIGFRCSHFLTADKRLRDRYELMHQRFGIVTDPARVEIVRPELNVIQSLIEQAAS